MRKIHCSWCSKTIEKIADSSLKNGQFIHNDCLKENIESNNQMMKKVIDEKDDVTKERKNK